MPPAATQLGVFAEGASSDEEMLAAALVEGGGRRGRGRGKGMLPC